MTSGGAVVKRGCTWPKCGVYGTRCRGCGLDVQKRLLLFPAFLTSARSSPPRTLPISPISPSEAALQRTSPIHPFFLFLPLLFQVRPSSFPSKSPFSFVLCPTRQPTLDPSPPARTPPNPLQICSFLSRWSCLQPPATFFPFLSLSHNLSSATPDKRTSFPLAFSSLKRIPMMSGEAWLYLLSVLLNAVNLFLQVFFTIMYVETSDFPGAVHAF